MNNKTLKAEAIQRSLNLSEQDALKVLIFISGMDAGKKLEDAESLTMESRYDRNLLARERRDEDE